MYLVRYSCVQVRRTTSNYHLIVSPVYLSTTRSPRKAGQDQRLQSTTEVKAAGESENAAATAEQAPSDLGKEISVIKRGTVLSTS